MRTPDLKDREQWLFARANEHLGLLRYDDLRAAGLKPTAIARRLAARRLTRVHDRVYAFGHTALRDEGRWLAALWTVGEDAVLSHFTAAAFHGWGVRDPDGLTHVSTLGAAQSRDDITVHRTRHLDRIDVMAAHPLRVTHIPRTLVDLADVMDWPEYRALADGLPYLAVDRIRAAQRRAPKRPGAPLVTRLIAADDAHTKSEFERRFLRFATARGIPRPDHLNHEVAGHKADCVYEAQQVVIELDGRGYHARRAQMRADRARDTDYQLVGYRIMRLVWDDLHADAAATTARRVRAMLRLPSDA
jgi:hypothetical protein